MSSLKRLAGQTAIYGVPSILGRLLNYLLVPLYTRIFLPEEYGIVTELYAYAGFLIVIYTYGLETSFFRFNQKYKQQPKVFSSAVSSLLFTSLLFTAIIIFLSPAIAEALYYPEHYNYIIWFGLITALDAIGAVPFASLRAENKAVRFAAIKFTNIALNIGFNLFFLVVCPEILESSKLSFLHEPINAIYNREFGIGYIFISNLIASAATVLLLLPQLKKVKFGFSKMIWKEMIKYGLPLLLVGLAGIINETLDRILLKFLLPYSPEQNQALIGIYGASYKLSILMTLFIQAFRYAAEPFFFSEAATENARDKYAMTLKYFTIAGAIIFIGVLLYLDILKYFIGPEYHSGLKVVPVLLLANLFLGMYYTLSVWYKITDRTDIGAYISIGGAVITILLNILLIPIMGYMGAAWTTLACYSSMALASYWLGQKYYHIPYETARVLMYIIIALVIYAVHYFFTSQLQEVYMYIINTLLILGYMFMAFLIERPDKLSGSD